jgi:hypothetical protein
VSFYFIKQVHSIWYYELVNCNYLNLKPNFAVTDNAFKVTLPNVNYKQEKKI